MVQGWAQYLWQIDYDFGFIRRALLGSVFRLFTGDLSASARDDAVLVVHYVSLGLWFLLVIGCYLVGLSKSEYRARHTTTLILAAALAAPAISTLSYNTGLADLFMQVLVLLAFVALVRENMPGFLACGLLGPFIHEAFLFIWMPLGCFALIGWVVNGSAKNRAWVAASFAPIVSWALVEFLDNPTAAANAIAITDLDEATRKEVLSIQLGFTLARSFETMLRLYSDYFYNFLVNSAYFLSLPIASLFVLPRLRPPSGRSPAVQRAPGVVSILLAAAILSPASVLLFAWDLSRFLTWTGCSLILTALFLLNRSAWFDWSVGMTYRAGQVLVGALGAWFLFSPMLNSYFDEATAIYMTSRYVPQLQAVMKLPPARLTFALKDHLNRNRSDYITNGATLNVCASVRPRGVVPTRNRRNCRVKVREGNAYWSDLYHLAPGDYTLEAHFGSNRKCPGGNIDAVVRRVGRHGPGAFARSAVSVQDEQTLILDFKVNPLLSGLVRARLVLTSNGGCVILRSARLTSQPKPS